MKIAVITIYDLNNFGNRLQNYALSYFLKERLGMEVCTAVYISKAEYKQKIKRNLAFLKRKSNVNNVIENAGSTDVAVVKDKKVDSSKLNKIFKKVNHAIYKLSKRKKFERFTNENINVYFYKPKNMPQLIKNFDYFVVGSDQVWNPAGWAIGNPENFEKYLLTAIPPKKRISYAASIGVEELPKEISGKFAREIKKFKAISVREQRGADIIKEISNMDAEVLIDPTMLLTKEDWLKVAKRHPKRSDRKPYAFKYFLGNQSEQRKAYIRKIAKKNGLGIYDVMNRDSKVYTSGPAEFLDLIANAEIIFTDSFHACVFSILMGKPFVIMNRDQAGMGNMNSRIVTLLEKLGLEEKLPENITEENMFKCDYKNAYKNLEVERKKAEEFLKKAFYN